jgi:hypothetical protein
LTAAIFEMKNRTEEEDYKLARKSSEKAAA